MYDGSKESLFFFFLGLEYKRSQRLYLAYKFECNVFSNTYICMTSILMFKYVPGHIWNIMNTNECMYAYIKT